MISVVGFYTTKFSELWEKSLFDLVKEASYGALKSASCEIGEIDAIFFGNMMGGLLENNLHSGAKISELLKVHIPVFRVESACASGGMAFHLGCNYILSGKAKTVLVVGAEKMTDFSPEEVVTGLAAAASGEEQEAGLTFPGLYAMMAQVYLSRNGYSEEHLAAVSVKNHFHGTLNKNAQFQKEIKIDTVLESTYVASPLKVLDCSPISDGASALVITSDKGLIKKTKPVAVAACEVATDAISLKQRKKLDEIEATQIAAQKSFAKARIKPKDITIAEVHDCFSIAEILAMEDIGFWKKGTGGARALSFETMLGQARDLVVNTSGGLKAAGHPVGATGIKQIGEIYLQLTGQAQARQIKKARRGLAHNVGGSGGTAVVTILEN